MEPVEPVLIVRESRQFQPARYDATSKSLMGAGRAIDPDLLTHFGGERIEVHGEEPDTLKSEYFAKALAVAERYKADYVLVKDNPKVLDVARGCRKIDEVISLYLTE